MSIVMRASAQHRENTADGFLQSLRRLIGRDCDYLGRGCRLIEVLGEEGLLVLETRERLPPIQTDQYGQPAYRGNDILQIPIFDAKGEGLSEDLVDLLRRLEPTNAPPRPGTR
jgi:hypothetical protein